MPAPESSATTAPLGYDPEAAKALRNNMVNLRTWLGAVAHLLPRRTIAYPDDALRPAGSPVGELFFASISPRIVGGSALIDSISFGIRDQGPYQGCTARFAQSRRRNTDSYFSPASGHLPDRFVMRDIVESLFLEVQTRAEGSTWVVQSGKNGIETTVIASDGSERVLSRVGDYPHSSEREEALPFVNARSLLGNMVDTASSHLDHVPGYHTLAQAGILPSQGFDPLTIEVPPALRPKFL